MFDVLECMMDVYLRAFSGSTIFHGSVRTWFRLALLTGYMEAQITTSEN